MGLSERISPLGVFLRHLQNKLHVAQRPNTTKSIVIIGVCISYSKIVYSEYAIVHVMLSV